VYIKREDEGGGRGVAVFEYCMYGLKDF